MKQFELYIETEGMAEWTLTFWGKRVRPIWQDVLRDVGITLISNRRMRECSWVKYRILCSRAVYRLLLSTSLASVSLCLCPHSFSILSSLWWVSLSFVSKTGQNIWSVAQTGRGKGCESMGQSKNRKRENGMKIIKYVKCKICSRLPAVVLTL